MKSNFLNANEFHLYRSSGHELGTIRKLRFSAFQRHQNYARRRRIIAFRDVVEISKIHQKIRFFLHLPVIHMRNVDAWKPKKFRPPINFYFLENTEGIWSNEIFRISKKIKNAIFQWFIFSIGFFSSKMNAVYRDLFKNVKIWGVRNIFCPKNDFLFFKFDEDWRCQKNSDH